MKRILIIAILLVSTKCFSQDTTFIQHDFYSSYFSSSKHIPVLVQYTLRKDMLNCKTHLARSNNFSKDPLFPAETNLQKDYDNSGFDRGHNMSAQDNECDATGMRECFYFSNMFPQPHEINAGVWENLERHERLIATANDSIKVFIGNIGKVKTIGKDKVVVPEFCWKVIYIYATKQYECYKIPNTKIPKGDNFGDFKISISQLEHENNFMFSGDQVKIQ